MKKISDFFMSKKKLMLIVGISLLVIVTVLVLIFSLNKDEYIGGVVNPDGTKFENDYESLNNLTNDNGENYIEVNIPSNNIMKYTNINEVLNIFKNDEDAVIYFGYPTCLYCRSAVQVLCDIASTTKLDVIYYLDVEHTDEKYNELLDILEEKFTVKEENETRIYVPLVLFVARGDIVSYHKGTLFSQNSPNKQLDKDQIEGLGGIYESGINDVLESIKGR